MLSGLGNTIATFPTQLPTAASSTSNSAGSGFSDVLKSAIQGVDDLQAGADMNISNLLQGAPSADVNHVMVSVEKADVAFQLMMQVRNKIVNAYQDIEKMQF